MTYVVLVFISHIYIYEGGTWLYILHENVILVN